VQTPQVMRPMTREQTRLGHGERITRILRGSVHVSCPSRNKAVRVFLCSGFTGKQFVSKPRVAVTYLFCLFMDPTLVSLKIQVVYMYLKSKVVIHIITREQIPRLSERSSMSACTRIWRPCVHSTGESSSWWTPTGAWPPPLWWRTTACPPSVSSSWTGAAGTPSSHSMLW